MSQSEMVQAAAREYTEEDIERKPLHILDPGNELLQELVDDFQKRVSGNMRQTRIACFYELQASEIGATVGKERRKVGKETNNYQLILISHRRLRLTSDPDV